MRLNNASSLPCADCTPKLSRFTPNDRKPARYSNVTVPGLASSVISQSPVSANDSRIAAKILESESSGVRDGVPPPKKMECASLPTRRPAKRISCAKARA